MLHGAHAGNSFGNTIAATTVADYDGDGEIDLGFGTYGMADPVGMPGDDGGAGYLFYGPFAPGGIDAADADAWWHGSEVGEEGTDFGYAGDLTSDGYPDTIIGGDLQTDVDLGHGEVSDSGVAYVFYGPHTGEYLFAGADWILEGEASADMAGWGVFAVGDLNADSFDDFAVGAPGHDGVTEDVGALYVCFGRGE